MHVSKLTNKQHHVGIPGNEKADIAAKKALQNPISDMTIPFSDFRHNISNYIKNCWQNTWNSEIHNKLHNINPRIGSGSSPPLPLSERGCGDDSPAFGSHPPYPYPHFIEFPQSCLPRLWDGPHRQSHPSHLPCFGHPPEFSILTRLYLQIFPGQLISYHT